MTRTKEEVEALILSWFIEGEIQTEGDAEVVRVVHRNGGNPDSFVDMLRMLDAIKIWTAWFKKKGMNVGPKVNA